MVLLCVVVGGEEEECQAAEEPAFRCCVARVDFCLDFGLDFLEGLSVQTVIGGVFALRHFAEDLRLRVSIVQNIIDFC